MSGAAPLGIANISLLLTTIYSLLTVTGRSEVERFRDSKAPQVKFSQGYGLTESSPVAMMQAIGNMVLNFTLPFFIHKTIGLINFLQNFGSIGSPSPATQAKVVNVDDPELVGMGPGETGEILIRGPHIMKGYYKNEAATKETIVKNGWLRTGDIGYYDKNFQFYITDRMKELIKVKGFQVAPAELEEILKCHPHVAGMQLLQQFIKTSAKISVISDAAVIGVPHQSSGEIPRGYIVAKPNAKIDKQHILAFVQDKVAPYKRLESVVVVDEIPKNATGKILRREIKAKYVQK